MSQYIVCLLVLVVAMKMWEHYTTEQSCQYCGTFRGHRQDCPHDIDQR
jgi:hypothetical protein